MSVVQIAVLECQFHGDRSHIFSLPFDLQLTIDLQLTTTITEQEDSSTIKQNTREIHLPVHLKVGGWDLEGLPHLSITLLGLDHMQYSRC